VRLRYLVEEEGRLGLDLPESVAVAHVPDHRGVGRLRLGQAAVPVYAVHDY